MNNGIKDFVVDKDVKCPICGSEMKKCKTLSGKSQFCCIGCEYRI